MGSRWEGPIPDGCPREHDQSSHEAGLGQSLWPVGEKGTNLFIAEFGSKVDMERVLSGTQWMVCRHAVILKPYDEKLSAAEIVFDRMEIWVWILNLPPG